MLDSDIIFVTQNNSHKGILLTFTIRYRENSKVKHKNIETFGYLGELKKKYDDPISHFKQLAKQYSNNEVNELIIKNWKSKTIDDDSHPKNLDNVILKKVNNELNFSSILNKKQSSLNIQYSLEEIMKLLIFSRILYPASKNETYNNKNAFFENFDFSLKDLSNIYNIDLSRKYLTLSEIKKILNLYKIFFYIQQ